MVSVPFEVRAVPDLVAYHDLAFSNGVLSQEVCQLAEAARGELARYFIKPVPQLADEEAYTVFCIDAPLIASDGRPLSAEDWLAQHRREVAALLTQEPDINQLSRQEADESTGRYLSYYENDLAVLDWDAALIVQEPSQVDETLYVLELANLQLAELEAYDRILDTALDRSYRDLNQRPRRRGEVMRELRELRIDLAHFSDDLSNITKFFGDWHLARIYENISARFHLADWHRAIDEKLKTLADLYYLLAQDRNNSWMLTLEITIVLLFVIDLVLLVMGLKNP
jgi:dsDNA-binding SOS-regulon protein